MFLLGTTEIIRSRYKDAAINKTQFITNYLFYFPFVPKGEWFL